MGKRTLNLRLKILGLILASYVTYLCGLGQVVSPLGALNLLICKVDLIILVLPKH